LFNGEQYRPFQHLLTKTSLMSARRAGALIGAIEEYGKAYDAYFGRCHVIESLMRVRRVSQVKSCGDDFAPRLHG
jgi:hypothetical protein